MTTNPFSMDATAHEALRAAADTAIAHVPPAFPLDATVAVNPYLGQAGEGRAMAAARLAATAGCRITRDRAEVAQALAEGRITDADLAAAAAAFDLTPEALRGAAERPAAQAEALPNVADLAHIADGVDWPDFVADRIGLWAATAFDAGQALWPAPQGGLFASWRAYAKRDLTVGLAGVGGFSQYVAALPDDPEAAFARACETLGLAPDAAPLYFHRLMMTLGGWGQLARMRGWVAERDGGTDGAAFALLTVRLVWDAALLEAFSDRLAADWTQARARFAAPVTPSPAEIADAALQEAADRAAERALAEALEAPVPARSAPARPAAQAAFCIDVRSEVFRRALESTDPEIDTIGFAGFFGITTAHRGAASDIVEARAPVLVAPGVESHATAAPETDAAARIARRALRAWDRFKVAAVSAFAFVEAAGPLYAGKLIKDTRARPKAWPASPAPAADLDLATRIGAAGTILRAMSLTEGFARVVLVAGHGAGVTNAPHASALQCGACGGHAGDVNARLLAGLLNDPETREGLKAEGIVIPDDTLFVAGVHDTVSDTVTMFVDSDGPDHVADLRRLETALAKAGALTRAERAVRLPRGGDGAALARRGGDWSEMRPEWGLAGCAAFIAAPRHRTAGRDLGGRTFLHSYDWRADDGFGVLELILTAPVVVASWISLQYHGSTVAPEVFGAGNKLLHNVTGGIGVVEGNGGTLRPGLPFQSVHDGEAPRHEPLRLSVVVEAPTEAIDGILDKHPGVRALFDNGWLSLHAMDAAGRLAARYEAGTWQETATAPALRVA